MPTPKAPKKSVLKSNGTPHVQGMDFTTTLDAFLRPAEDARYTFDKGTAVRLNKLNEAVYVSLMSDHGKPKPPMRAVEYLGGAIVDEPRGDDEPVLTDEAIDALDDPAQQEAERAYAAYRQELQRWTARRGWQFWSTLFIFGVADTPPADVVQMFQWMGFTHPLEIKYQWLASLLSDGETDRFIEAVISHTVPTEEGLAEAKERFPGPVAARNGRLEGPGDVAPAETESPAGR